MNTLDLLLCVASAPVLGCAAYLAVLAAVARRPREPAPVSDVIRFDVVIPAHDEASGIAATVASVAAAEYPADRRRILVVADNCRDDTAARAAAAGAIVLVRDDPARRGKGWALAHAFARVEADGVADAVVVIDADTSVSRNLLLAFAGRIVAGAHVLQADYGVRNPHASWRTRLLVIALTLFHVLRSLSRERLSLSAGLRGNGMGFTREVLRAVPHHAVSLVEDVEYGIALGRAGYRVGFVPEAHVLGDMVPGERDARAQRRRWEDGRAAIARCFGPLLLRDAVLRRDRVLLDLAVDLLVPPLSTIVLAIALGSSLATTLVAGFSHPSWILLPWATSAACVVFYVARGWALSGTGLAGLAALACAPAFVAWKVLLRIRERRARTWVRTARATTEAHGHGS